LLEHVGDGRAGLFRLFPQLLGVQADVAVGGRLKVWPEIADLSGFSL